MNLLPMKNLLLALLTVTGICAYAKPVCEAEVGATLSYTKLVRMAVEHGLLTHANVTQLSRMRKAKMPMLSQGRNEYTLAIRQGFARVLSRATPQSWKETKQELKALATEMTGTTNLRQRTIENTHAVFSARPLPLLQIPELDTEDYISTLTTRAGHTLIAYLSERYVMVRDLVSGDEIYKLERSSIYSDPARQPPLPNLREDKRGKILLDLATHGGLDNILIHTVDTATGKISKRSIDVDLNFSDGSLLQVTLQNGEHFYLLKGRLGPMVVIHSSGKMLQLPTSHTYASQFAVTSSGTTVFAAYEDRHARLYEFSKSEFKELASFPIDYIRNPGVLLISRNGDQILASAGGGLHLQKFGGEHLVGLNLPALNDSFAVHEGQDGNIYIAIARNSRSNPTIDVYDAHHEGRLFTKLPFEGDSSTLHLKWIRQNDRDILLAVSCDAVAAYVLEGGDLKLLNRFHAPFNPREGYIYFIEGAKTPYVMGRTQGRVWQPLEIFSSPSPQ